MPRATLSALLFILLVVDSLHFVFAGLIKQYVSPVMGAMLVLSIAAAEVGLYLVWRRNIRWSLLRRYWLFFAIIGFLVAASTAANYAAVAFIDPGTASLLGKTGILFSLALSLFWLRETLTRSEAVGSVITLIGVGVISFQPGDYWQLGSLLVLASSFMYALHAAVIKRYGGEMEFSNFFFFRVAGTASFLLLFVVGLGEWQWPSRQSWPVLVAAGTVDVVISRVLYYWTLRRWQMNYHTIVLSLSPAMTILVAFLLFGTQPTVQGWVGGVIALAGVLLVTTSQQRLTKPKSSTQNPEL